MEPKNTMRANERLSRLDQQDEHIVLSREAPLLARRGTIFESGLAASVRMH